MSSRDVELEPGVCFCCALHAISVVCLGLAVNI